MENKGRRATVTLTQEDYLQFARFLSEKEMYIWYGAVIFGLAGKYIVKDIGGLGGIFLFFFSCIATIKAHGKISMSGQLCHKATIPELGIGSIGINTSYCGKWNALYDLKPDKNGIIFMNGKSSGIVIPKRLGNTVHLVRVDKTFRNNKLNNTVSAKIKSYRGCIAGIVCFLAMIFFNGLFKIVTKQ
ncbi:putative membrane protein [Propionispora sp. 2/2-37]|uniref:hypothetical protein n=1 Tax=Propionispora sp. 2/2-37 TaxID=1677858 RepID=UPI0006BB75AC|nr:hypothetical protein [Propionispora sp. 2/2-37]CUH97696.1 putative membrane protein [Propionispora sp. 2/2-37]